MIFWTELAQTWQKINFFRKKSDSCQFSCLYHKSKLITTNRDKAEVFAEILKARFAGHNELVEEDFHKKVEKEILTFKESNPLALISDPGLIRSPNRPSDYIPITYSELCENIKRLKNHSAPGKDKIYNLMLKNLTPKFLQFILTLFNLCLSQGVSPKIWKPAVVTMIPKGSKIATDPNNYRAISNYRSLGTQPSSQPSNNTPSRTRNRKRKGPHRA